MRSAISSLCLLPKYADAAMVTAPSSRNRPMRQSSRLLGLAVLSAVMAEAILLSGCATSAAPPTSALAEDAPALRDALPVPATINPDPAASSDLTPVVRYGRYTLVELVPEPAQRDLMRQVVEVVIPPSLDTNVGDALRHVLRRSGYRLCDTADATALYALPLPAAHPIRPATRSVCVSR